MNKNKWVFGFNWPIAGIEIYFGMVTAVKLREKNRIRSQDIQCYMKTLVSCSYWRHVEASVLQKKPQKYSWLTGTDCGDWSHMSCFLLSAKHDISACANMPGLNWFDGTVRLKPFVWPGVQEELQERAPSYLLCFLRLWQLRAWRLQHLSGAVEKSSLRVPQRAKNRKKCYRNHPVERKATICVRSKNV